MFCCITSILAVLNFLSNSEIIVSISDDIVFSWVGALGFCPLLSAGFFAAELLEQPGSAIMQNIKMRATIVRGLFKPITSVPYEFSLNIDIDIIYIAQNSNQ